MQSNPRKHQRTARLLPLMAALPLLLSAGTASAHIDVDMGGTHKSRVSGGYEIKDAPCGVADAPRSTNVYRYRPGATITIKVYENISHPGYFRISFDNDGDDGFVIPSGTSGEFGDCGGNASCGPGKEDYCSNDTVLIDNLDPHAAGEAKTYTWSVTLPNIECTNCTLQIIQMMNDFAPFHSPASYPADDIYYHCIDIELAKDAPETTDTPVETKGMVCKNTAPSGAAGSPGTPSAAGAGATAGAAGAPAQAAAGAGGTASTPQKPSETQAPTAGMAAPSPTTTAGSAGSKAASGGSTAAPATAGSSAPTTGGSSTSGVSGTAAGASESGGCQAAGGSTSNQLAPALLAVLTLSLRRHRRRHSA